MKNMKKFFSLLNLIIFLSFQFHPTVVAYGFEPQCVCCPPFKLLGLDCLPPSALLDDELNAVLKNLNTIRKELSQSSLFARPTSARINFLIKRVKKLIDLNVEDCKNKISFILEEFQTVVSKFVSRRCTETIKRRCIPSSVVDNFKARLEEAIQELDSVLKIDDDVTGIPDICRG